MPPRFITYKNGQQHGPYSESEMIAQIQSGITSRDELIWREGDIDWEPASKLLAGILPPELPAKLKHSRIGIASFVVSLLTAGLVIILVLVAGVFEALNPGSLDDDKSPTVILLGVFVMLALMVAILAFGMALASLIMEKNTKKTFSILGLVFSLFTVLGVIVLMIIGLSS